MRLLDLYCGGGGASAGYAEAGWQVTGVDYDERMRRHYPHKTLLIGDALEWLAVIGYRFDAIVASPPCQDHSLLRHRTGVTHGTGDLLDLTIEALEALGKPYIVENVESAQRPGGIVLCGSMFGLGTICRDGQFRQLRRHRRFWSNVDISAPGPCRHAYPSIGVHGGGPSHGRGFKASAPEAREVLGIDWLPRDLLSQAIPPAYTSWLGRQLLEAA